MPSTLPVIERIYRKLSGIPLLHPQWLSNRYHRAKLRWLASLRSCTVLDIGSGDLDLSPFLDGSNRLLKLDYPMTSAHYTHTPDVYGDAQALPFPSQSLDAAILFEVLEHLPDHRLALSEIARVLKPGGKLFLSAPFIYPLHDAPFDFFRFSRFGLGGLLETHGLRVGTEVPLGNGFVVALQLLNLALLESVRKALAQSRLLGLGLVLVAYPLCLFNNLLALPLLKARFAESGCFGYFIIAERV